MQQEYGIKILGMKRLPKASHTGFHLQVEAHVKATTAETLGCTESDLTAYSNALAAQQKIVNLQSASVYTPDIARLDSERGELLRLIFEAIDFACKNKFNAAAAEAGKWLTPIFAPYRQVMTHNLDAESAEIEGLFVDIATADMQPHLAAIPDLIAMLGALDSANKAVQDLVAQRDASAPTKAETNAKRTATEEAYYTIRNKANATLLLHPTDAVEAFVNDVNNLIDRTVTTYNTHLGRIHSSGKKPPVDPDMPADNPNPTPEPDPTTDPDLPAEM